MIRPYFLATLALFASLVFTTPSSAITINVEGFVSHINSIFYPYVSLGDQMKASFAFDPYEISRTYDFAPGRSFHYLPSLSYELWFGNIYVFGSGGRAEVTNNYTDSYGRYWDRLIFQNGGSASISAPLLEGNFDVNYLAADITFYDFVEAAAITSSDMVTAIDASMFDSITTSIQVEVAGGSFVWMPMFSHVTNIEIIDNPAPVPEPSTWILLGTGLAGLALYAERKARTEKHSETPHPPSP